MNDDARSEYRLGLARWMRAVVDEREKVVENFDVDAVHDLRVAIRRCRSLAQGLREIDPHPDWRALNRDGRRLFAALGAIRDTHVLLEWVRRLGAADDPVTIAAVEHLEAHEAEQRLELEKPLRRFDVDAWERFAANLAPRAEILEPGGLVYRNLALRRWQDANALHRVALKNRSKPAWHALRIGIKRFRYMVENFLPELHDEWGADLKTLQDLLGEVHDLDVLWDMLPVLGPIFRTTVRLRWRDAIAKERAARLSAYRAMMVGPSSLWRVWRAKLPLGDELVESGFASLDAWASFCDEGHAKARHASRLALELFEALFNATGDPRFNDAKTYRILRAASCVSRAGARGGRDTRRTTARSARLIRRRVHPVGWTAEEMDLVAGVVESQSPSGAASEIDEADRDRVRTAGATLRLARALAANREGGIRVASVEIQNGCVVIDTPGLPADLSVGEEIARARFSLERLLGKPVFVPRSIAEPALRGRRVRGDSATDRVSRGIAGDTPRRGKTGRRARPR